MRTATTPKPDDVLWTLLDTSPAARASLSALLDEEPDPLARVAVYALAVLAAVLALRFMRWLFGL